MIDTGVRQAISAVAAGLLALLLAAGCGASGERKSNLRPPSPIDVDVAIDANSVTAFPLKFGAGPIRLVASNQSNAAHRLTLDGPRVRKSVGPIAPQETGSIKVTVGPGEYSLSADGAEGVDPAKLQVGPKRPSAQNELLQP